MIDIKPFCTEEEYNFHLQKLAKDIDEKTLQVGDKVVYALTQRGAGPVYMGKIISINLQASTIRGTNNPDLNQIECWIEIQGLKTSGWRGTKKVTRRPGSIAKI